MSIYDTPGQKCMTYELRYMQYRIEKVTERGVASSNKYSGVISLIIESGMLYTTSAVRKISTIQTLQFF